MFATTFDANTVVILRKKLGFQYHNYTENHEKLPLHHTLESFLPNGVFEVE